MVGAISGRPAGLHRIADRERANASRPAFPTAITNISNAMRLSSSKMAAICRAICRMKRKQRCAIWWRALPAALGVTNGTVKGDIVVHNGEPYVIELAARLSGGFFCTREIPLNTGVDFIGAAIKLALGEAVAPDELTPKHQTPVIQRYAFPKSRQGHARGWRRRSAQNPRHRRNRRHRQAGRRHSAGGRQAAIGCDGAGHGRIARGGACRQPMMRLPDLRIETA